MRVKCFFREENKKERKKENRKKRERERKRERSELIFGRSSIVATLPRKTDSEMPEEDRPRPIFHLHNSHLPLLFEGNYKQASTILDEREREREKRQWAAPLSSFRENFLELGLDLDCIRRRGWRSVNACRNFLNHVGEREASVVGMT